MRFVATLLLAVVSMTWVGQPVSAAGSAQEVSEAPEMAFRAAFEAWAFDAHWRLWDMGTSATRAALPQQEFTERMRRGNTEPESGSRLGAIDVLSQSATVALVRARFVVRHARRGWSEVVERPFLLMFEDGEWRVNLWDFVGLASYFPPEYLPMRPGTFPRGRRP
jgi:hypothetical protein